MTETTPPPETEEQKVLAESKAVIADLETDEKKAVTYYRAHALWIVGLCSFLLGAIAGAVIVAKL
jgi:hypothetical protein